MSLALKLLWPSLPFMDRVGLVFLACIVLAVVVTLLEKSDEHPRAIDMQGMNFSTSRGFNQAAIGIVLILTALYTTWW